VGLGAIYIYFEVLFSSRTFAVGLRAMYFFSHVFMFVLMLFFSSLPELIAAEPEATLVVLITPITKHTHTLSRTHALTALIAVGVDAIHFRCIVRFFFVFFSPELIAV